MTLLGRLPVPEIGFFPSSAFAAVNGLVFIGVAGVGGAGGAWTSEITKRTHFGVQPRRKHNCLRPPKRTRFVPDRDAGTDEDDLGDLNRVAVQNLRWVG